jgi:GH15 family glucan-1,4-alpha-glucosidase
VERPDAQGDGTTLTHASTLAPHRVGASKPIADYGPLSDCNSAALVARDGSIDSLCLPRFDGPAVFAAILDPDAGHWSIRPAGDLTSERRYRTAP